MRCLLVTKEFSTIPTSGGMLRTLALVEQLAQHYDITVISPHSALTAGPGRAPSLEFRTAGRTDLIRDVRLATRYRSISGVRTAGHKLLDNLARGGSGHYDVGILDHTCLAGLADDIAVGCDRLLVSMHNIESDLMAQRAAAATSTRSRLAMQAETRLLRRLETHVADRYPLVVCTEADARALRPRHGAITCRNGVFAVDTEPTPGRSAGQRTALSMVFSGALDWEPNIAGLLWFLQHSWPLIRARIPTATVTIAGRKPGPEVIAACGTAGVTLLADPPVMATVLEAHPLGIVPLLNGGGSRIKILEYLAAGIDIVSTDVGASGLEDIPDELLDRVPVDPVRFADSVVRRLQTPRDTSASAQEWVRKNYSWAVTLRPLIDVLVG